MSKLHLCWVHQDEDQENSDERHHVDSNMKMDDAKSQNSEMCSVYLVLSCGFIRSLSSAKLNFKRAFLLFARSGAGFPSSEENAPALGAEVCPCVSRLSFRCRIQCRDVWTRL